MTEASRLLRKGGTFYLFRYFRTLALLVPSQKLMKLIERLIKASSDEGDLILDPFAGSGSTVMSAAKLNRYFITIEKDKTYYKIVSDRYNEYM